MHQRLRRGAVGRVKLLNELQEVRIVAEDERTYDVGGGAEPPWRRRWSSRGWRCEEIRLEG
jgi:hypothetical protein